MDGCVKMGLGNLFLLLQLLISQGHCSSLLSKVLGRLEFFKDSYDGGRTSVWIMGSVTDEEIQICLDMPQGLCRLAQCGTFLQDSLGILVFKSLGDWSTCQGTLSDSFESSSAIIVLSTAEKLKTAETVLKDAPLRLDSKVRFNEK